MESPDDEKLQNYAPRLLEGMTKAGAKFIARGMPFATVGNGITQRIVIAEFYTAESAKAAFNNVA